MKTRSWANFMLAFALFLVVGFTVVGFTFPWWVPQVLARYASRTDYQVQMFNAGWSKEGFRLGLLKLSAPGLDIQINDLVIRWHSWNSGPQFSAAVESSTVKLNRRLQETRELTAKPDHTEPLRSLDLEPFAFLFNRVALVELPVIEILTNKTSPVWASLRLSSITTINILSANDIHVQLALLSKRPETNSLKYFNLQQSTGKELFSPKQAQPLLYFGSLEFNAEARSWSMSNRLFLSPLHHWVLSDSTMINAKFLTLLESLTAIKGTAFVELSGQFEDQTLIMAPLQGRLELDSSIELVTALDQVKTLNVVTTLNNGATNNVDTAFPIHTHHQLNVSWPFRLDTYWHTGPIQIHLLGQRQTPMPDRHQLMQNLAKLSPLLGDQWPNVWSLDLSIPRLEGRDTYLSGSAVVEAQLSGNQWESRLRVQAPHIHCEGEPLSYLSFLDQAVNFDNLTCQWPFQVQIASESQHPDLKATGTSNMDGKLTLQQQRFRLLLEKALIEIQDISYAQGNTQRIVLSADPLEIKINQPLEMSGRLRGIVQKSIFKSQLPQQSKITNLQTPEPTTQPTAFSAQLNVEVSPKRSFPQSSDSKAHLTATPLQHLLNIRLNVLDELTFKGSANLIFPQAYQKTPFKLSELALEQQPMSASKLQYLLANLNLLPEGLQLTTGQIKTKFFAQDLADTEGIIEFSVNIDDVSIQQEQQNLQGLKGNMFLKGSRTQLLSHGLTQNSIHVRLINAGIPLDNLNAKLFVEIHPMTNQPFQLTFNQIGLEVLGGMANIPKLQVWPLDQSTSVLELSDLDLSQLVRLQSQPGISASGRLQGRLPFGFNESGAVFINKGTLAATPAGGHISVKDNPSANAFKTKSPQLKQAVEALEYLQFSTLTSEASMSSEGDLIFKARIEGKNPQKENNRPIVFNYTHEENLYLLLKSLLINDQMAKKVEDKIK